MNRRTPRKLALLGLEQVALFPNLDLASSRIASVDACGVSDVGWLRVDRTDHPALFAASWSLSKRTDFSMAAVAAD